tara:strand:- start:3815 stop:4342 length:528 start_codon:yes stop_codon:yes gene_type:complete
MFFKKNKSYISVDKIYNKIVLLSRNKTFYLKLKIPDTIDGRFDMLLLFSIIVVYKLSSIKPNGKELAQKLFDRIFLDLDYSLREIGAGDVGVSSKIKTMASAFLGRQKVYCSSFENNNIENLVDNLNNNVYRNVSVDRKIIKKLALYSFKSIDKLNLYKNSKILSGCFEFPELNI